jgi:hypothetical protein
MLSKTSYVQMMVHVMERLNTINIPEYYEYITHSHRDTPSKRLAMSDVRNFDDNLAVMCLVFSHITYTSKYVHGKIMYRHGTKVISSRYRYLTILDHYFVNYLDADAKSGEVYDRIDNQMFANMVVHHAPVMLNIIPRDFITQDIIDYCKSCGMLFNFYPDNVPDNVKVMYGTEWWYDWYACRSNPTDFYDIPLSCVTSDLIRCAVARNGITFSYPTLNCDCTSVMNNDINRTYYHMFTHDIVNSLIEMYPCAVVWLVHMIDTKHTTQLVLNGKTKYKPLGTMRLINYCINNGIDVDEQTVHTVLGDRRCDANVMRNVMHVNLKTKCYIDTLRNRCQNVL